MKILSIDSSSKVATAAIVNEDGLIAEYTLNNKAEHSILIMEMIDNILKSSNLTIDDIDGFAVSKGPGSFTGLRIGMATIKGLSFGSNKPYISISTLDALAYSLLNFDGIICPIMDALRDSVYTGLYKNNNGVLETLLEPSALDLEELVTLLKDKNEKVIFTGDGLLKHKEYLKNNLENVYFPPNHLSVIKASSLAELGLIELTKGISDDPDSSPFYLKKPQAQRELESRLALKNENSL